ncbi:MAG: hypothetical protein M1353_02390 [Nitrospirae bacterium]|nr:hypothetical protein [Nitrospirota bacterium]
MARELLTKEIRTFVGRQYYMMGYHVVPQGKLFYMGIDLDKKVRRNHPLRKIIEIVDFDFIYQEVKKSYGGNGNVSVPSAVILKLILLLVFYVCQIREGANGNLA